MDLVEPIPGEPAALATVDGDRTLLVADYHAGVEAGLRYERGVEIPSRADDRRERLCSLVERTRAAHLVVLGDLMHSIGDPGGAERGELEVLFEALPPMEVTLVKGNHDGAIESWLGGPAEGAAPNGSSDENGPSTPVETGSEFGVDLTVVPGSGVRLGPIGVCHGHSWPAPSVLDAAVICMGHEHPCVRLEDEVGGSRIDPVWLRGRLDPAPFRPRPEYESVPWLDAVENDGSDESTTTADSAEPIDPADPTGSNDSTDESGPGSTDDLGPGSTADTGSGSAADATPSLVVVPAFNDLVGGTWINVPGQSFLAPFLPEGLVAADAYLLDGTELGPYRSI